MAGMKKGRIRVVRRNGGDWKEGDWFETTDKKPGSDEFYISYTIHAGFKDFRVEGEVYNPYFGWK